MKQKKNTTKKKIEKKKRREETIDKQLCGNQIIQTKTTIKIQINTANNNELFK